MSSRFEDEMGMLLDSDSEAQDEWAKFLEAKEKLQKLGERGISEVSIYRLEFRYQRGVLAVQYLNLEVLKGLDDVMLKRWGITQEDIRRLREEPNAETSHARASLAELDRHQKRPTRL